MTLDLGAVTQQLRDMGQSLATENEAYKARLEEAIRLRHERSDDWQHLSNLVREARRYGFYAARPLEPLNTQLAPGPHPAHLTVLGSDGSQIEPDRHGPALCALINIGSIVYRHGSGQKPTTYSQPRLYYGDEVYEPGTRRLLQGNRLDVRRSVMELERLADLAEKERVMAPCLALVDGTLLLWFLEEVEESRRQEHLRDYLRALDRLCQANVLVAAYTSRPRYNEVVRLLRLATLSEPLVASYFDPETPDPFDALADRFIFPDLSPWARSGRFISPSPINDQYGDHQIHFFYLQTGSEIARVETPAWVSNDPDRLALLHTAIVEQSRLADYPYVLGRAHELAVVTGADRDEFTNMVVGTLLRHGIPVRPSSKASLKTVLGQTTPRR